MGGVYVSNVANVDNGQWHVKTLAWSLNEVLKEPNMTQPNSDGSKEGWCSDLSALVMNVSQVG